MAVTLEINWCNYGSYEIMDVSQKSHEKVLAFMLEHFRSYDLYKVLEFQQEKDIEKDYIKIVKHILDNDCSIVVLHKDTKEIHGAALLRWMTHAWHSWLGLELIIESQRFKELYNMVRNCLDKWKTETSSEDADLDSMHLFTYHLHEDLLQDEEFLQQFFYAITEVARHMHMPRVTFMCLSGKDREFMERAGFEEVSRVIYSLYVFQGRRPFDHLRDINEMYGSLVERKVAPLIPYQEMVVRHQLNKEAKEEQKKPKEEAKK